MPRADVPYVPWDGEDDDEDEPQRGDRFAAQPDDLGEFLDEIRESADGEKPGWWARGFRPGTGEAVEPPEAEEDRLSADEPGLDEAPEAESARDAPEDGEEAGGEEDSEGDWLQDELEALEPVDITKA